MSEIANFDINPELVRTRETGAAFRMFWAQLVRNAFARADAFGIPSDTHINLVGVEISHEEPGYTHTPTEQERRLSRIKHSQGRGDHTEGEAKYAVMVPEDRKGRRHWAQILMNGYKAELSASVSPGRDFWTECLPYASHSVAMNDENLTVIEKVLEIGKMAQPEEFKYDVTIRI